MGYVEVDKRYSKRGYASNMERIDRFCKKNNIKHSANSDSYYFTVKGQRYRVSTHTVEQSNAGAYDNQGNKIREFYHSEYDCDGRINIIASKLKIIDIYKAVVSGKKICDTY